MATNFFETPVNTEPAVSEFERAMVPPPDLTPGQRMGQAGNLFGLAAARMMGMTSAEEQARVAAAQRQAQLNEIQAAAAQEATNEMEFVQGVGRRLIGAGFYEEGINALGILREMRAEEASIGADSALAAEREASAEETLAMIDPETSLKEAEATLKQAQARGERADVDETKARTDQIRKEIDELDLKMKGEHPDQTEEEKSAIKDATKEKRLSMLADAKRMKLDTQYGLEIPDSVTDEGFGNFQKRFLEVVPGEVRRRYDSTWTKPLTQTQAMGGLIAGDQGYDYPAAAVPNPLQQGIDVPSPQGGTPQGGPGRIQVFGQR